MKQKKEIPEPVVFSLVQFYAVVLFECNEAEDYGPAMTLMNTAFSFHHEGMSQTFFTTAFLPRDAMLARYILSSCVWLSVRLSVCMCKVK